MGNFEYYILVQCFKLRIGEDRSKIPCQKLEASLLDALKLGLLLGGAYKHREHIFQAQIFFYEREAHKRQLVELVPLADTNQLAHNLALGILLDRVRVEIVHEALERLVGYIVEVDGLGRRGTRLQALQENVFEESAPSRHNISMTIDYLALHFEFDIAKLVAVQQGLQVH